MYYLLLLLASRTLLPLDIFVNALNIRYHGVLARRELVVIVAGLSIGHLLHVGRG